MDKFFIIFARLISIFVPNRRLRRRIRKDIWQFPFRCKVRKQAQKVGKNLYVSSPSSVNRRTIIGDNCGFSGITVNGKGNLTIGNHFRSGAELLFLTQNHNYKDALTLPYDEEYIYKDTIIGDCVWCGARVTILPGTRIGEGVIVQAGSVVHGEIPPCAIIGGNPAVIIKYRDKEHYYKLKKENKFHYGG